MKRSAQSDSVIRRDVIKSAGVGVLAMTGSAGCIGDDDGIDDDELEDEVVVYTSPDITDLGDRFEDEFGVEVGQERYSGPQTTRTFVSEAQADTYIADVVVSSGDFMGRESTAQYIREVELDRPNVMGEEIREIWQDLGIIDQVWPFASFLRGHQVNTDIFEDRDDWPETWEDYLDPKYEGEVVATGGSGAARIYSTLLRAGWSEDEAEEYMLDLDENAAVWTGGGPEATEAVTVGDGGVSHQVLGDHVAHSATDEVPHIEVTYPEMTSEHVLCAGISVEAPHPNAAQQFVEWLTSDDGQEAVYESGRHPTHVDFDHGTEEVREAIEEWDPEIIPLVWTEEEAGEFMGKISDLLEF